MRGMSGSLPLLSKFSFQGVFFLSEMIRIHKASSFYRLKEEGFQGRVAQSRSAAAADCKAKASPVCGLIVKTTALRKLPTCSFSPRSFWGKSSFLKGIPAHANGTSETRPSPSLCPLLGLQGGSFSLCKSLPPDTMLTLTDALGSGLGMKY